MSVFIKLNQARIKLQNTELTKSGHNKFAGYRYFELGDFLPTVQSIFADLGLCGIVSYGTEIASLTIVDTEDNSNIVITSPMGSAALKGCHEVQNIGAVETYQRRYLWVTAMEIVEHDALDATNGKETPVTKLPELKSVSLKDFDQEEQDYLKGVAVEVTAYITDGLNKEAYELSSTLDQDEKLAIWELFDSKTRSALKKYSSTINQLKAA